jgi:hypothetical protein
MRSLLNLAKAKFIYFCNKPLPRAKPEEIKKLTIAEVNTLFAKRRNLSQFNWSTDYHVPDQWQLSEADKHTLASLEKEQIPSDKFVLCYINDVVGYGIFAREPIAKMSIAFYGGKLIPKSNRDSSYCFMYDNGSILDAYEMGAHSSIFQDLYPASRRLGVDWSFVARNNFISTLLPLSCGSLTFLRATTDIEAGMQCGLDYGKLYWKILHIKSNLSKQYFDMNGNCIEDPYQKDFLAINELTATEIDAIRRNLPVSKALDESSLSKYAPISLLAREIIRLKKGTLKLEQAEEKVTTPLAPPFFKRIESNDIEEKNKQNSTKDAGNAFRKS